jgi:hypothetical protein
MKDTELRGLLLQKFYEHRRERQYVPNVAELGGGLSAQDLYSICDQLDDNNLIHWKPFLSVLGVSGGWGRITARGVDVIEGTVEPPITIVLNHAPNISVSSSSNVQIGDGNSQSLTMEIEKLVSAIDHSTANEEQKKEAKSRLKSFLEHPLVCSIAGGLASSVQLK